MDENGFFYMVMVSGNSVAFAPSYDVDHGEALIADAAEARARGMVDLKEAFSRPGHTRFLMNAADFDTFMVAIKEGKIRSHTRQ
ncbi:hypothetical protein GCM10011491_41580 [Brucella endophytica]|uniref:Uncharacterized protein n=2 Tax=Brucella endophytica TaxID=1963359 RepID=A0A916SPH5_9HYPH|nr:hypothetical protein GCM10011491_41580 [Brucella endophytica]